MTDIFATWAPTYWQRGFTPLPITPGQKACHAPNWQAPMTEERLSQLVISNANHGIGLLMGTPFHDGTTLGAMDIDDDTLVRLGRALLGDPPCSRVGKKGCVIFFRASGSVPNGEFRLRLPSGKRGSKHTEIMTTKKLIVIPPTIHPETQQPYSWVGTPLHELDYTDLPIIEVAS